MGQAVRKDEIPELQKTSANCTTMAASLCAAFASNNRLVSLLELVDSQYVKIRKNFAVDAAGVADEPDDMDFLPKTCAEKM